MPGPFFLCISSCLATNDLYAHERFVQRLLARQILHSQLLPLQIQRLLPPGMQAPSAGIGINIRKMDPADGNSGRMAHHGLYLVTQLAPAGGAAKAVRDTEIVWKRHRQRQAA